MERLPLPLLAAGGELDPLVRDIGLCLLVAAVLTVLCARLRVPTIAALLGAGLFLGPNGAGVVTDNHNIQTIASLGLVLLLFLIGLEIDLRKLAGSGRPLILTGLLQFPLCVLFGWGVTRALGAAGWAGVGGTYVPVYVGLTVAASSTLLVVKLLQERGQMDTVVGRVAIGVLIFQDIWAVVVLAVQPNFADPRLGVVGGTFLGIVILTLLAVAGARWVLPTAFRWIAPMPEAMLVAAVGWCFAVGFLGRSLGDIAHGVGVDLPLSVSLEMGALIAGASIASLPYSGQLVSKVGVVHDFFITLFFVALGMQIPRPDGWGPIVLAVFLAATCIAARYLIFFPLFAWTGLDRRAAFVTSTRLAQVSEFCLVIAYLGMVAGHVDRDVVSAVIFAFVITALSLPFLFDRGDAWHDRLGPLLDALRFRRPDPAAHHEDEERGAEVVMLGIHRAGASLLYEIERHHPEIRDRVLVVDFNVALHEEIARRGFRVRYGDFSSAEMLHHAGVAEARVVVCTIPDDMLKGTSNLRLVRLLRTLNRDNCIIVNAVTLASVEELYSAGADYVLVPRVETARRLFAALRSALSGDLDSWRREQRDEQGVTPDRNEVLP